MGDPRLMSAIAVTLACGCRVVLGSTDEAPHCETHDERRVQRVVAPPPRFVSVGCEATGPYVKKAS